MAVEIKIGDRISWVDLVKQDGSLLEIDIDGKILKVDVMHTADGTFSILANGHSYNIELVPFHQRPKKYTAYTLYQEFDVEIILKKDNIHRVSLELKLIENGNKGNNNR